MRLKYIPDKTLVIAEIGVNHNGDICLAKEMVAAAKECGADIVKFQTYKAEEVMTNQTPLAGYMKGGDKNFLDLARRLELTFGETLELKDLASKIGIEFLSSPFDVHACEFLGSIGLKRLKIPSGETVNPFLLKAAAATQLPLIVSTGMATLDEIRDSIAYLVSYRSGPITLLHCTTQYPAEPRLANLRAMVTLGREFNLPMGYSDHTPGIEVSLAAVALGATVIEKHLTLNKNLPGPDQAASLEPQEFKALVEGTRSVNSALGDGEKRPWPVEIELAKIARKSIVTTKKFHPGHVIVDGDLNAKRPGTGIPAMAADKLIGRTVAHYVAENTLLKWSDIV